MIPSDFTIEVAHFDNDLTALRAVREPVFVIEQRVPIELEWDELDPVCQHVLARDLAGSPIGTGRLAPDHRIGRMAVLPDWRNRGVGAAMLTALVDLARGSGYNEVVLHAQVSAIRFYQRHGFQAYGERFEEAGIGHQCMRRDLEPFAPRTLPSLPPRPESIERAIESLEQAQVLCAELIADTRRELWMYTRTLDPLLLDRIPALQGIQRLATAGHEVAVRVIVQDPATVMREGHGLIALGQRLSSSILFRTATDEVDLQYPSAFVANDLGGYLFRPLGSRFEGTGNRYAPARARQLVDYFGRVWERSTPTLEFRQLHM
ncbi:MAG TPA: GNAT family N-acetyltransferase [Xanthomonadaceae bacterium]|nr:GNAT family N-acetyltransferase [Xanthomonadaceae bacterium]